MKVNYPDCYGRYGEIDHCDKCDWYFGCFCLREMELIEEGKIAQNENATKGDE